MPTTELIPSPVSLESTIAKAFDVDVTELQTITSDALRLKVDGPNDKKGFEIVKRARIDIGKVRIAIEKTRVAQKAEALRYGKIVDQTAKSLAAIIAPGEEHLIAQERIVTDEAERLKRVAEEARLAEIARFEREKREAEEAARAAERAEFERQKAAFEAEQAEARRLAKIEADKAAAELAEAKRIADEQAAAELAKLREQEEAQRIEREKLAA